MLSRLSEEERKQRNWDEMNTCYFGRRRAGAPPTKVLLSQSAGREREGLPAIDFRP